ncbi:MAG: DUF86 domain-containing protein [Prevotella stercorea]|nr:DUF86 domain-containing protein [Leyella stercorea]
MRERIRDKSRLEHILQAIERIMRYIKGKTFDDFIADDMMYYAVVKNIEIIGEASNMLTEEFRNTHPDTPWKLVNGMRNYINGSLKFEITAKRLYAASQRVL